MDITQYSVVLSVMSLLLGVVLALSILGYVFSPVVRQQLLQIPYTLWLQCIGLLSAFSILGALIYQFVYLTPVCALCWWQRIFLFPIALIVATSLYTRTKTNHLFTGLMAGIGLLFALYHYYGHFQKYVMGNPLLIPCSSSALEPSCGDSPIIIFQFVTIPLMGVIAFAAILWFSYLAYKKSQVSAESQ